MSSIDLRKKVRLHEVFSEALSSISLKELDYETMFFLFAKISKTHLDETVYDLNIKELQELTGNQYNLREYVESVKRLRKITFEIEDQESVLIDGVLSNARFIKGKGTVRVKISSDMKPYLLQLTNNYTEHQLYSILRLNSKHAKKLYLYFCNHRPKSGIVRSVIDFQTIEDFKKTLGFINPETGEELHKKWNHFKERVVDVAKEEINKRSNLKVAYNIKKWGREVYWIEWIIENKNNEELIKLESFTQLGLKEGDKDFAEAIDDLAFIERLKDDYGLDKDQAKKVAKMLDRKLLENSLKKVDDAKKNNKIKTSLGGYTRKILLTDFGTDLKI